MNNAAVTNDATVQALDIEDRDRFTMIFDDVWNALKGKSAFFVYMALKRRANQDRKQWFGTHKALAEESGVSEKTFRRGIEHLEEIGLVVATRRFAPKGWDRKDESKLSFGERDKDHPEEIGKLYQIRFHIPAGQNDQRGGGKSDQTPPGKNDQRGGGKSDHQTYIPLNEDTQDVNTRSSSSDEHGTPNPFNKFWDVYPRKIGDKQKVQSKFNDLAETVGADTLIQAARNFAAEHDANQTAKRYIPYPSTFLNQDRWKDYAHQTQQQHAPKPSIDEISTWEIDWAEEDQENHELAF